MILRPPAKLVDRRANRKRCNDFVEAAAKGFYAGTSEAVTRGENCDARWLAPLPNGHTRHSPPPMVSYTSHFLTRGDSDARSGSEFFVLKLIVLLFDELTRPATNVLLYRIGPLLSPAPGGLARRLLRLINESTVGRRSSFDRDMIGVRAGLPRTNFAGLFCPPAVRIACLSQS